MTNRQRKGMTNDSGNILSTILHSQNPDDRDDWGVPLIRTYSPERARMGTDTDNVYPQISPVRGGSTRMPGDKTMLHEQINDDRVDCGLPVKTSHTTTMANERRMPGDTKTYSPERARIGTRTDCVNAPIVSVEGECIFCSVTSYSTSSRGTISEDHDSAYMTCQNCYSKFCISCIDKLVESIEGFDSIPPTVKRCDASYCLIASV